MPWGEAHRPAPDPTAIAQGMKALELLAEYHRCPDAEWDAGDWEARTLALVDAVDERQRGRAARTLVERMATNDACIGWSEP